ncbi:MAG TPA: hypothetical protein VFQ39_20090, partial [Longimicrobium sp.]|nr:hypothetical protein [Longimicrobium sp.]
VLSLQTYTQATAGLAENTGVCCPSEASCNSKTSAAIVPVPVPVDPRPFEPIPGDSWTWV